MCLVIILVAVFGFVCLNGPCHRSRYAHVNESCGWKVFMVNIAEHSSCGEVIGCRWLRDSDGCSPQRLRFFPHLALLWLISPSYSPCQPFSQVVASSEPTFPKVSLRLRGKVYTWGLVQQTPTPPPTICSRSSVTLVLLISLPSQRLRLGRHQYEFS